MIPNPHTAELEQSAEKFNIQSSLHFSWSYWPLGYAAEYQLHLQLANHQLAALVDACIREVLSPLRISFSTVLDVKGIDREPLPEEHLPLSSKSMLEELVFASGRTSPLESALEEHLDETEYLAQTEPFQWYLLTAFEQFIQREHISHKLQSIQYGHVPSYVNWLSLGRSSRVLLQHFRVGLELFHPHNMIVWGVTPVADERLALEANRKELILAISADCLPKKTILPLQTGGLIDRLNAVFVALFGFNIKEDYLHKQQRHYH